MITSREAVVIGLEAVIEEVEVVTMVIEEIVVTEVIVGTEVIAATEEIVGTEVIGVTEAIAVIAVIVMIEANVDEVTTRTVMKRKWKQIYFSERTFLSGCRNLHCSVFLQKRRC
jgi:hypothetical protein